MTSVCLYFKVHQPYRLKNYKPEDITVNSCYEDPAADAENIDRMADESYLPANEIISQQINEQNGKFRISFSVSGTILELFMRHRPDVIKSFKKLAATGCVEFLSETYYHSLSSFHSSNEFQRQVSKHAELITRLFGKEPVVFRNTELIHNNKIAQIIANMGLKGILCEGVERILKGRSVNQVYTSPGLESYREDFSLLLRNAALSDDIAFRFNDTTWSEHPLTADKFAEWLSSHPANDKVINLFMDYETFGIHKKNDTGIFDFLKSLPSEVLKNDGLKFATPSEVINEQFPKDVYDVPETISWEDKSEASCVWCENVMQNNTLKKIYSIGKLVQQSDCEKSVDLWGRLQAADYFYYMSEKKAEASKYLNPFTTPREAFQNYTNLVTDFEISLIRKGIEKQKKYSSTRISSGNTLF
jgi:alpha-amylase